MSAFILFLTFLASSASWAGPSITGGAEGVTIAEGIFSHFADGDDNEFTVTKHPNRTESISVRNLVCKKFDREDFHCSAIDTVKNRRIRIKSPSFGNFAGVNLLGYDGGPLGMIEYTVHFEIDAIDCVNWWTGPKLKTSTKCSYKGIRRDF